ncbi:MAG: hypothetical protein IPM14_04615 [bacterium]|nr:hypothetical protein [bacterium]
MKKIILIAATFFLLANFIHSQSRGFGLGIVLGEPTGLSAKLWTSSSNAFDFAAAWSFKGDGHLLLQADYVWHSFDLIRVSSGRLPLYYGIGGRVILADDPLLGIRIPLGLNYQFDSAPIDIFAEIVPILDLVPSTDFDLGGGIGVRFWFN